MLTIKDNKIQLTRGDTARISLAISQGSNDYNYSGDTVVFTVKRTTTDTTALFQRPVSDGVIHIRPQDTASLDYGRYVYDVQVTTAGGDVYTVIEPSEFTVTKEVTF